MAGQIAELARGTLRGEFRSIDSGESRVLLIEILDRVLTTFPPSLSRRAARSLESLGVTLLLERTVVDIDGRGGHRRRVRRLHRARPGAHRDLGRGRRGVSLASQLAECPVRRSTVPGG